jgi:hypothetical protein
MVDPRLDDSSIMIAYIRLLVHGRVVCAAIASGSRVKSEYAAAAGGEGRHRNYCVRAVWLEVGTIPAYRRPISAAGESGE